MEGVHSKWNLGFVPSYPLYSYADRVAVRTTVHRDKDPLVRVVLAYS